MAVKVLLLGEDGVERRLLERRLGEVRGAQVVSIIEECLSALDKGPAPDLIVMGWGNFRPATFWLVRQRRTEQTSIWVWSKFQHRAAYLELWGAELILNADETSIETLVAHLRDFVARRQPRVAAPLTVGG